MSGCNPHPRERSGAVQVSVMDNFRDFGAAISRAFVPLRVSTDHVNPFHGVIRSASVDDVHVYEVTAGAHLVERTEELIARDERALMKVSVQLAGAALLVQDDREAVIRPGDMAIYDTRRPYSLCFEAEARTMVLMFPKRLLALPANMVNELAAIRFGGEEPLTAMVVPFLTGMAQHLDALSGPDAVRITRSALDLITTVMSHRLDITADGLDSHQMLVQQIRRYIEVNLSSPDLGPVQIAAAHYISTRHLHSIFREQGTTVSSWIRTQRLEHCRRDLQDPLLGGRSVASISARWGFVDAAHFSRVFKAAFSESPSELRTRAA